MDAEISLPDGILLRSIRDTDAAALAEAYRAERTHLEPWEPRRDERFFTAIRQRELIGRELDAAASGTALGLVLVAGEQVVGRVTLSGIVRGPFRSANLGYWIAAGRTGRGLMTAAVDAVAQMAADARGLHRLQAATLLRNARSQAVLRRCGFTEIGVASEYLNIDGRWQDHLLFQRILTPPTTPMP